jgi:hypothetical protein
MSLPYQAKGRNARGAVRRFYEWRKVIGRAQAHLALLPFIFRKLNAYEANPLTEDNVTAGY